jgi:ubiquinone/menaquinone biosynthesis C-methylase UbiE
MEEGLSKEIVRRYGTMAKNPEPSFHFRLMALTYAVRDLLQPPLEVLKELGIRAGFHVLDYGCGPGSYIIPLAGLIGPTGRIYALDIHPLAVKMVNRRAAKNHLANVVTIQSDGRTGLPDQSLDAVLLFDVFHDLEQPGVVLRELNRVLKPEGVLSFSDHHLSEQDIVSGVTGEGFFRFVQKGRKTYSFSKAD